MEVTCDRRNFKPALGILIQQSILRQPGYQESGNMETGSVPLYYGGVWLSRCYWIPPHVCDLLPRLYRNCKVLQVHRRSYSDSGRAAGGRLRWSGCQRNRQNWIGFGRLRVAVTSLMMFYVPIYGAILYKYRDGGVSALCRAILWLILPVFITSRIPSLWCSRHHDGQYADRTYGGCLEGVVSTACEKTIIGMWLLLRQGRSWY